jgi:hypothetical protein
MRILRSQQPFLTRGLGAFGEVIRSQVPGGGYRVLGSGCGRVRQGMLVSIDKWLSSAMDFCVMVKG